MYEVTKTPDKSSGGMKTVRKLVGKLDDAGNIVPISGVNNKYFPVFLG